ncbi:MAG TPA: imelysin family protein [Polyangia bacterium]|nr:imelysin family protein [Polyangia bacterium]
MRSLRLLLVLLGASLLGAACSSSSPALSPDAQFQANVVSGMRSSFITDLGNLVSFSQMLQSAAPTPADRGWDATLDADAFTAMKVAWTGCRTAYEHIEGATAPIFPDIDATIDSRYDDFLAALPNGDPYLFDDVGVTGMHAVERILYSNVTPARVIAYESTLPGYVASAFPGTPQEASDFKGKLVQKQITDAQTLQTGWENAKSYDLGAAFQGLVSLMNEQQEKVDKASTDQEESRYSQTTMADIRNNLAGTERVYLLFQPWIQSKAAVTLDGGAGGDAGAGDGGAPQDGKTIDAAIEAGFAQLQTLYSSVQGDAIPQPPDTWSSENPTTTDEATPFGMLYEGVHQAVDPNRPGSVVAEMNAAAVLLGFPQFVAE